MTHDAITPDDVLHFWFGNQPEQSYSDPGFSKLWWSKDDQVDKDITSRFQSTVRAAAAGELSAWESSAAGVLALIILADQFPRNMFRERPASFEYDGAALSWCLRGIENGWDQEVLPIQRVFWYLPLEHSESLDHQHTCVALMKRLAAEANEDSQTAFDFFVGYAIKHQTIIEQFGRYPHRNAILGRESTTEELAFLQTPGSSF
jgi:uncharacterized protein (DUF924 family)